MRSFRRLVSIILEKDRHFQIRYTRRHGWRFPRQQNFRRNCVRLWQQTDQQLRSQLLRLSQVDFRQKYLRSWQQMHHYQFKQQLMLIQLFLHNQLVGQFPRWKTRRVPTAVEPLWVKLLSVEPLWVKLPARRSPVEGKAKEVCHQDR